MRDHDGGATLTTKQVAALCPDDVNESAVRYLARAGVLPGRKEGTRWRFAPADAERFCDEWRGRRDRALAGAGTGRGARHALNRALRGNTVAVLNVGASLVGIGAVAVDALPPLAGLVLAVLNALGAALAWAWSRLRLPTGADLVDGEPVPAAAAEWGRQAGAWSVLAGVPVATLLATVGVVAVAATPLFDDEDDPPSNGHTPVGGTGWVIVDDPCAVDVEAAVPGATDVSGGDDLMEDVGLEAGGFATCSWLVVRNERFEGDDFVADWEVSVWVEVEPHGGQPQDDWLQEMRRRPEAGGGCAEEVVPGDDIPVCRAEAPGEVALYARADRTLAVTLRATEPYELVKERYPDGDLRTAAEQLVAGLLVRDDG